MTSPADPIVPIPGYAELTPAFQARARRGKERLGVNVNSLHAFAHSEELGGATRDYFEAVARLTILPHDLRLLIRLATATANQCRYCTAHQRHQLNGLGVSEEKMAAIWQPDADALSPRERAAVRFAQAITLDAGAIPDNVYADFIREFTPQERIEVAIVATSMGMLNKLNDALRIPLEAEFEALVA
ncbi:MAG TPA: carboxymuconolactone decarboxylase family protein [Stellaceae bacterium]|nr:carboxymuconolactone decarboxylase family protein [Stellaceae bacterium]